MFFTYNFRLFWPFPTIFWWRMPLIVSWLSNDGRFESQQFESTEKCLEIMSWKMSQKFALKDMSQKIFWKMKNVLEKCLGIFRPNVLAWNQVLACRWINPKCDWFFLCVVLLELSKPVYTLPDKTLSHFKNHQNWGIILVVGKLPPIRILIFLLIASSMWKSLKIIQKQEWNSCNFVEGNTDVWKAVLVEIIPVIIKNIEKTVSTLTQKVEWQQFKAVNLKSCSDSVWLFYPPVVHNKIIKIREEQR